MKTYEFIGKILHKKPQKVYKRNEFYGNINYKVTVLKEENQEKIFLFVYANLANKKVLSTLEQIQYINKRYYLVCERKNRNLILTNLQEYE